MGLGLLVSSEGVSIKSYHHDYPKVTWSKRTPTILPNYKYKSSGSFSSTQRTTGFELRETGKRPGLPGRRAHQLAFQFIASPENGNISNYVESISEQEKYN